MKPRQITLRIDQSLFDMIEGRATANRRSVNQEIAVLLEDQIDTITARDIDLIKRMPGQSPSEEQ